MHIWINQRDESCPRPKDVDFLSLTVINIKTIMESTLIFSFLLWRKGAHQMVFILFTITKLSCVLWWRWRLGDTDCLQSPPMIILTLVKKAFVPDFSTCGKGAVTFRRLAVHGNEFISVNEPWAGSQLGKWGEYSLSNCRCPLFH